MPTALKSLTHRTAETYARLTAPAHIRLHHFREHQRIEGYSENRGVPGFVGSDRLLKLDTLYGAIQLGYHPQRGQSFLFAHIKTSIFDNAASRYQRELKEYQMMRGLKTGTQNLAYTAKRWSGSSIVLYKADNLPWSRRSVLPYLRRANMETLAKTMPFLEQESERTGLAQAGREQKSLNSALRDCMARRAYSEMAGIRARQVALLARRGELQALQRRKDTQQRYFFRRLNVALDTQKHEMFAYYRDRRAAPPPSARAPANQEDAEDKND